MHSRLERDEIPTEISCRQDNTVDSGRQQNHQQKPHGAAHLATLMLHYEEAWPVKRLAFQFDALKTKPVVPNLPTLPPCSVQRFNGVENGQRLVARKSH